MSYIKTIYYKFRSSLKLRLLKHRIHNIQIYNKDDFFQIDIDDLTTKADISSNIHYS